MKAKITKPFVESLTPETKRFRVWDTALPGFYLRVLPSGVKSFVVRYHNNGRNLDYTLGKFPEMTVAAARIAATKAIGRAKGEKVDLLEQRKAVTSQKKEDLAAKRRARHETLRGFIEHKYQSWVLSNLKSGKERLRVLNQDFASLLDKRLDAITPWEIQKWVAQAKTAGLQPTTINRRTADLKSVLSKAVEWGVIESNPLRGMKRLQSDSKEQVRFLTGDEEKALRETLEQRQDAQRMERVRHNEWLAARHREQLPLLDQRYTDYLMPLVLLALNTGMRRGELFNLEVANINLSKRLLTVVGKQAKSGLTRHIPLNDEAFQVLVTWMNQTTPTGLVFPSPQTGKRLDNINTAWRNLIRQSGIEQFRFHDLRHTFASKLVMRRVELNTVRELLGHSKIEMTLRYAHLDPEYKSRAVAVLSD